MENVTYRGITAKNGNFKLAIKIKDIVISVPMNEEANAIVRRIGIMNLTDSDKEEIMKANISVLDEYGQWK